MDSSMVMDQVDLDGGGEMVLWEEQMEGEVMVRVRVGTAEMED